MKIGFYPGSFDPWHEGHQDVLEKALKLFDKIVILQLTNPDKMGSMRLPEIKGMQSGIEVLQRANTFLFIVIGNYLLGMPDKDHEFAIIRGLRNGQDLEYEKVQQYWNEDLGMKIPTVYFISDRKYTHISSSAIRMIDKLSEMQKNIEKQAFGATDDTEPVTDS